MMKNTGKPPRKHKCRVCGYHFYAPYGKAVFCGHECRGIDLRERKLKSNPKHG